MKKYKVVSVFTLEVAAICNSIEEATKICLEKAKKNGKWYTIVPA